MRKIKGIFLAVGLSVFVIGILTLAESSSKEPSCFLHAYLWYVPCLLNVYRDLAGALIGAAGTVFAGWLAWEAIRYQTSLAKVERDARQAEIKELAVIILKPLMDTIGLTAQNLDIALSNAPKVIADDAVAKLKPSVQMLEKIYRGLDLAPVMQGLSAHDMQVLAMIDSSVKTFLVISDHQPPGYTQQQRLKQLRDGLNTAIRLAFVFDEEVATTVFRHFQIDKPAAGAA